MRLRVLQGEPNAAATFTPYKTQVPHVREDVRQDQSFAGSFEVVREWMSTHIVLVCTEITPVKSHTCVRMSIATSRSHAPMNYSGTCAHTTAVDRTRASCAASLFYDAIIFANICVHIRNIEVRRDRIVCPIHSAKHRPLRDVTVTGSAFKLEFRRHPTAAESSCEQETTNRTT
jgi:hypothetical protein